MARFFEIMLRSVNMDDQDFIWRNVCTLCVQKCQIVASTNHELCDFIGKCRSCDNYIDPYQSPNKCVERDYLVGKLCGKNSFTPASGGVKESGT